MDRKITKTNRPNNMVTYTIEEADAALNTMIEMTLSEFDSACDKIDTEYANQSSVSTKIAVEE